MRVVTALIFLSLVFSNIDLKAQDDFPPEVWTNKGLTVENSKDIRYLLYPLPDDTYSLGINYKDLAERCERILKAADLNIKDTYKEGIFHWYASEPHLLFEIDTGGNGGFSINLAFRRPITFKVGNIEHDTVAHTFEANVTLTDTTGNTKLFYYWFDNLMKYFLRNYKEANQNSKL